MRSGGTGQPTATGYLEPAEDTSACCGHGRSRVRDLPGESFHSETSIRRYPINFIALPADTCSRTACFAPSNVSACTVLIASRTDHCYNLSPWKFKIKSHFRAPSATRSSGRLLWCSAQNRKGIHSSRRVICLPTRRFEVPIVHLIDMRMEPSWKALLISQLCEAKTKFANSPAMSAPSSAQLACEFREVIDRTTVGPASDCSCSSESSRSYATRREK